MWSCTACYDRGRKSKLGHNLCVYFFTEKMDVLSQSIARVKPPHLSCHCSSDASLFCEWNHLLLRAFQETASQVTVKNKQFQLELNPNRCNDLVTWWTSADYEATRRDVCSLLNLARRLEATEKNESALRRTPTSTSKCFSFPFSFICTQEYQSTKTIICGFEVVSQSAQQLVCKGLRFKVEELILSYLDWVPPPPKKAPRLPSQAMLSASSAYFPF